MLLLPSQSYLALRAGRVVRLDHPLFKTLMNIRSILIDFYGGWVTKEISGGKKGFKGGESTFLLSRSNHVLAILIVRSTGYPPGAGPS